MPVSLVGDRDPEGKPYRRSLKTRSFERAEKLKRNLEDGATPKTALPTIAIAIQKFLRDAEQGRKLKAATVKKYRVVLTQLEAFAQAKGVTDIGAIDVDFCREFRQSWADGTISSGKKLERLRAFCRFVSVAGWLPSNPALSVVVPNSEVVPTLPFTDAEMAAFLKEATDPRWHALIQVLRWAGLRIGDAMELTTDKIEGNPTCQHPDCTASATDVDHLVPIRSYVSNQALVSLVNTRLSTLSGMRNTR
jgi:site-specific recombinase XerD